MRQHFSSQRSLIVMGAAAFALFAGHVLEAQAQDRDSADDERAWEFIASLGIPFGGPADGIEEMMRASGWDDTSLGDVDHPFSIDPTPTWALSLRRSLRPHLDVELMATRAVTGGTHGFHEEGFAFGQFLFLNHSVTALSPIVSYRVGGWHAGAGPTANRVSVDLGDFAEEDSKEEWKLGVLADTGITFPRRSRLFFEGRGQYRWIPDTSVGPSTSVGAFPEAVPVTMPEVDIQLSHVFLSFGLGARF